MTKIAASLICSNPLNIESDIDELIKSKVDMIHFDVMDGKFVQRHGLYVEILRELRKKTEIIVDAHMMIENPEDYIDLYANADTDIYCFHIETTNHANRVIEKIKKSGMRVGVALNPSTPINSLEWIIKDIDMICVMAMNYTLAKD